MKDFYISECIRHENKVVTSNFVVVSKQIKPKKTGEPYLALTLGDRSGQLDAKMWDNVEEVLTVFEQDDFLKIKGLVNKYKNRFQLTIHKLRKLGDSEIEFADYLPKTTKDIDELWRTLGEFVNSFQNLYLQDLIRAFMADPEIAAAYRNAPAAKTLHHAYIGGLLDHVVSLFRSCDLICRNYPQVNRDVLLTGVFLHDIGKIHELAYNRSFSYTTRGQLLGHMVIELEMLQAKLGIGSGVSERAEDLAGASDHQPPWRIRIRIAQVADVSGGAPAALYGRPGFQDGGDASALRTGDRSRKSMDQLQRFAGPSSAEYCEISCGANQRD